MERKRLALSDDSYRRRVGVSKDNEPEEVIAFWITASSVGVVTGLVVLRLVSWLRERSII